jgi:hypothetical protein
VPSGLGHARLEHLHRPALQGRGVPWRIVRDPSDLTSCNVGVGSYNTLDGEKLLTSTAQVFNERVDGWPLTGPRG